MKYLLKKDLPIHKAGTPCHLSSKWNLVATEDGIVVYEKSTLAKFPNILTEWFEVVPEKRNAVPALNDNIYLVTDTWGIRHWQYGIIAGSAIANQGNWRWTQKEAEAEVKKRAAIERVRRYIVSNDLLEENKRKDYRIVYTRNGNVRIETILYDVFYYSPYGRIKNKDNPKFLEDCREDLLIIHS